MLMFGQIEYCVMTNNFQVLDKKFLNLVLTEICIEKEITDINLRKISD